MFAEKPYFAFEHGTLRDIPNKNDTQGRLTSLAYRLAEHVFVTNFDCIDNAKYLAPKRFTVINHPFDEEQGIEIGGVETLRLEMQNKLGSEFIAFYPTRHDWVEGTGLADKGNDKFLRAFVELRKAGLKVGLVCCNWGKNVQESKKIISDANCASYVWSGLSPCL